MELGRGLLGFGAGLRRKEAGAGLQAEAKREGNGPTWLGPRIEGKEAGQLPYGPGWRKREWPSWACAEWREERSEWPWGQNREGVFFSFPKALFKSFKKCLKSF